MTRLFNKPFKPFMLMLLLLLMTALGGIYSPMAFGAGTQVDSSVVLAPAGATTWTGAVDTNWATAGNWDTNAVPTASDSLVIADVANDPVIGNGTTALATNVIVNSGAVLTVNTGGTLTIDGNGASLDGIKNDGTVTNEGTINIDDFSGTHDQHAIYNVTGTFNNQNNGVINIGTLGAANNIAGDGIQNHEASANFTNGSGSTITINGVGHRGIFARLGSFTNEGTITIDTVGHVRADNGQGIYNDGTFNNQNSGTLNIDNVTLEGIYNDNAFTNQTGGTINIGTQGGANNITKEGIDNRGTFTNSTGSTVTIKDVAAHGVLIAGTSTGFVNDGTINIDNTAQIGFFMGSSTGFNLGGALNIGKNTGGITGTGFQLDQDGFVVNIEGTTAGLSTGYGQVDVVGTVTLASKSLTLSGSYTPQAGDIFTIINNDGTDAVSGTFSGLAEGDTVTFNSDTYTIFYVGGDGNDVVLTNAETHVKLTSGILRITDIKGGTSDDTLTLTLVDSGSNLQIKDPNNTLVGSGTGVVQVDANTVKVPVANITASVTLDTKDGNDIVNLDAALNLDSGNLTVTTDIINVNAALGTGQDGEVSLTAAQNIAMNSGASLTTVGGDITLNANTSDATSGDFDGIVLNDADISTTTGAVTLNGHGGDTSGSEGVRIVNGSTIAATGTGSAGITIMGTVTSGGGDRAIEIENSGTQISSAGGTIQLTGTSNGDEAIIVDTGAQVVATGSTSISLTGTSSNSGSSTSHGIILKGTGAITSVNGDIQVTGNAATSIGLLLEGVGISSTGTGGITLSGTATGGSDDGIRIISSSLISTSSGAIQVTGSTAGDDGIQMQSGADITSTSGTITMNGTTTASSGDGRGILISGSGIEVSTSADIQLTGQSSTSKNGIFAGGGAIVNAGSGNLTLIADKVDLANSNTLQGTGQLTIKPQTASTTIGIGGGTGTLGLADSELSALQDGFSSITIGDATNGTGEVNIDTATFNDPVTIAGGTIKDNSGTDIAAATNAVTLKGNVAPGQSPGILNVTGNLALADNDTFTVEIGGTTPGEATNNHDQINVVGTVTIGSNVTLSASAVNSYVPADGDEIVIINNDSNDAVSGTFNGLVEGATVSVGGQDMTLSYEGGTDGNDVVLTLTATVIDLSSFSVEVVDSDPLAVEVHWETAAEIDNAGFNLHRATSADGPYLQINDALIAASGQPDAGERYSFIDTPGTGTFFYKLEDVDIQGGSSWHGPVSVDISTPTAVSLSDLTQQESSKPYGLVITLALVGLVALRKVRRR